MAVPLKVLPGGSELAGAPAIDRAARSAGPARRPRLSVIPGRRRATRAVVSIMTVLSVAMGGVVYINTRLAQRQIALDEIDGQLVDEQEKFDELRAQRAELRAPNRLAPMAELLGMQPATESKFSSVDPWVYARQIALGGRLPSGSTNDGGVVVSQDPMEQYRSVKQIIEDAP